MKLRDSILKSRITKYSVALFFAAVFIFSRTFMGIYIFGFRVGEIMMGVSLFFSFGFNYFF